MDATVSLLIGYDHKHEGDTSVLIVGQKEKNNTVKIINAFSGKEAEELYRKLTTKK